MQLICEKNAQGTRVESDAQYKKKRSQWCLTPVCPLRGAESAHPEHGTLHRPPRSPLAPRLCVHHGVERPQEQLRSALRLRLDCLQDPCNALNGREAVIGWLPPDAVVAALLGARREGELGQALQPGVLPQDAPRLGPGAVENHEHSRSGVPGAQNDRVVTGVKQADGGGGSGDGGGRLCEDFGAVGVPHGLALGEAEAGYPCCANLDATRGNAEVEVVMRDEMR